MSARSPSLRGQLVVPFGKDFGFVYNPKVVKGRMAPPYSVFFSPPDIGPVAKLNHGRTVLFDCRKSTDQKYPNQWKAINIRFVP